MVNCKTQTAKTFTCLWSFRLVLVQLLGCSLRASGLSCLVRVSLYVWCIGPYQILTLTVVVCGVCLCMPGALRCTVSVWSPWRLKDWVAKVSDGDELLHANRSRLLTFGMCCHISLLEESRTDCGTPQEWK